MGNTILLIIGIPLYKGIVNQSTDVSAVFTRERVGLSMAYPQGQQKIV